jgi:hypothetical protein
MGIPNGAPLALALGEALAGGLGDPAGPREVGGSAEDHAALSITILCSILFTNGVRQCLTASKNILRNRPISMRLRNNHFEMDVG